MRCAAAFGLLGLALGAAGARAARTYVVRPGDSLTAIAVTHGTTVRTLARLNDLSPSGVLLAGSRLTLPGPSLVRYRVQSGDTLTSIAARFGGSAAVLARENRMSLAQTLLSGSVIHVPAGVSARPSTAASSAVGSYTVRPGDTLSSIALHFSVSLGSLAELNGMGMDDLLPVGRTLRIPAGAPAAGAGSFARSSVRGSLLFWANHYGVDPHLVTALAWMESGFNNDLVSPTGAVGVMQVMPDTWDYVEQVLLLGRSVPHDADGNVRVGVAYVHHLLHIYGGDEHKALAAYYQGARALDVAGFLPGTQQYVDDILALKARF